MITWIFVVLIHIATVGKAIFIESPISTLDWEATVCYKGQCNKLHVNASVSDNFSEKKYKAIAFSCGDLCDHLTNKPTYNFFINVRKVKVDCRAIFQNEEIDETYTGTPFTWTAIPSRIQNEFTHFGAVTQADWYINESDMGGGMKTEVIYSKKYIDDMVKRVKNGKPRENYWGGARDVTAAIDSQCAVKGKHVLVIGSQSPWVEAILIYKGASKVTTVEFGNFTSHHPQLEYMRPSQFRLKFINGTLPLFDHVFTYSSVEHSGLGRYGDGINPWGDVLTIAKTWCTTFSDAKLIIAVPVNYQQDCIVFNAHRIYGRVLYPFLVTNWKFRWSSAGDFKFKSKSCKHYRQPTYVFEKINVI